MTARSRALTPADVLTQIREREWQVGEDREAFVLARVRRHPNWTAAFALEALALAGLNPREGN